MRTATDIARFVGALAACAALAGLPAAAAAQTCPAPGADCTTGQLQLVDFESLPAGASVEGLGAVHPNLAIASMVSVSVPCAVGSARVIEESNTFPYSAYGTPSGDNQCLDGIHGFADDHDCILDYEFTFSPGTTVSCFSIRMFDYGDYFPHGGTTHNVRLRAYAGVTPVDQDILTVVGNVSPNGDACTAGVNDPGARTFTVTGAGITRVTLTFDEYADPNVGFDSIQFCRVRDAVPVATPNWGRVKTLYRD